MPKVGLDEYPPFAFGGSSTVADLLQEVMITKIPALIFTEKIQGELAWLLITKYKYELLSTALQRFLSERIIIES